MSTEKIRTGVLGEKIACRYLERRGYKILYKNYSQPRWGEIDVIALDKKELVFVEVRTRTNDQFGNPLESISSNKIKALKRSINYFLTTDGSKYNNYSMRIDAVGIILDLVTWKVVNLDHVTLEV